MNTDDLDELTKEIFDPDLPGVFNALFNSGRNSVLGKLGKGFVETDRIVGIRAYFLCSSKAVLELNEGERVIIDSVEYTVESKEPEGIATVRLILGNY